MPSFRCPKCKERLTADGSRPTVNCTACGQLCAIPRQTVATNPTIATPLAAPPKRDDVIDLPPDVLDVSEAQDEVVTDVVEAEDEWADRGPRPRRGPKPRKKRSKIRRPTWDDDRRGGSWLLSPPSIATAIILLLGIVFTFLAFASVAGAKVLVGYGIAMQVIAIIWGISLASSDGEGAKAFFWAYRWVYLVNNLDRGLFPMVVELAGIFFMVLGWAA